VVELMGVAPCGSCLCQVSMPFPTDSVMAGSMDREVLLKALEEPREALVEGLR